MKHRKTIFGVIAILGSLSRDASAQGFGGGGVGGAMPAGPSSGPSSGRPDVTPTPEDTDGPIKQGRNSVKLFDAYRSILAYQIDVGPIWVRRASNTTVLSRRTNFEHEAPAAGEITIGSVWTTPGQRGPFFLSSEQMTTFRVLDSKSFSWSLFGERAGGGITVGPFDFEGEIGVNLVTADIIHAQPSIQVLSPRVEAGVGFRLGKFRLDIKGHSEYLWRWFGPDYLIRGVTIGLRLDRTRPKNPFPGAPSE